MLSLIRHRIALVPSGLRSRTLHSTPRALAGFDRPSPPSLSRNEQKDFEELLRRVNAPASPSSHPDAAAATQEEHNIDYNSGSQEEALHPDYRVKPKADFEGEINPETGEVGGPKHEPLQHGPSRLALLV